MHLFYIPVKTPALGYAAEALAKAGIPVTFSPSEEVSHVLLPIPTKNCSPAGGWPEDAVVFGGNLLRPNCHSIDLLKDETYLWENAKITAYCALKIASVHLPTVFCGLPILVIGFGRIGKHLCSLLQALGGQVTVATQKPASVPHIFSAIETAFIDPSPYRLIFNTAPAPVLNGNLAAEQTVLIDLASTDGIAGDRAIRARGLPGKEAPEASGALIAETVLRYLRKENV